MTKYITCKSNTILQRFSLTWRSLSLEIIMGHSLATIVFVQQQLFQQYYKRTVYKFGCFRLKISFRSKRIFYNWIGTVSYFFNISNHDKCITIIEVTLQNTSQVTKIVVCNPIMQIFYSKKDFTFYRLCQSNIAP